jgi:hypothetical protein
VSAAQIKTQRGIATYHADGRMNHVWHFVNCDDGTPVLVVPLANVKGCKHDDNKVYGMSTAYGSSLESCANCGAMRWNNKRWTLPRVLRVGR